MQRTREVITRRPSHTPLRTFVAPLLGVLPRASAFLDTRLGFAIAYGGVILLSLLMRTANLAGSDLWVDETISYFVANRPPLDVIRYTASNIAEHPPGYYFLLHFWMRLVGTGEFGIRFLSVIGALLSIALMVLVARRWFGNKVALLAGLLLTVQPLALFLGRDARMYSWFMASVVLMVYLLGRAIERKTWLSWLLFAGAAFLALTFNYLATLAMAGLTLFFAANFKRLKSSALAFGLVLLVLLGLPLVWIITEPGPRASALDLIKWMREPWDLWRLLPVYLGWPLGTAGDNGPTPSLLALAGFRWLLVLAGILFMVQPRRLLRGQAQWLLACLIFVPPLLGSVIFVISKARYYSAVLGFFTLAVALGVVACWRRWRPLGAALLAALLIMNGRDALSYTHGNWRPFSAPMNFVLQRARPAETVVYTFPWDSFLDGYYDTRQLPAAYVPPTLAPVTVTEAETSGRELLEAGGSVWLMVYPTELKPEDVQKGFDRAGYPDAITWFTGSRGVVRYFADRPLDEHPGGVVWGDRIRLARWWSAAPQVAAGDALRLQFEWSQLANGKAGGQKDDGPSELIEASLVGPDGQTWAARLAAPCNGGCPAAKWGDKPVQEREALYIPADTPPGKYAVRVRWLSPSGEPILAQQTAGAAPQAFFALMEVEVLAPEAGLSEVPLARPANAAATDGKLTLVSFNAPASGLVGGRIATPLQTAVKAPLEPLEARLVLKTGGADTVMAQPLGPAWYGSETWTPGRLVRTQPSFVLPPTLAPGKYALAVEIGKPNGGEALVRADAGTFEVRDREHSFTMPALGQPVSVDWQEGIHLARVLTPAEVTAGQTMTVTLVWRADRPTGGNWKVFLHLVDSQGTVRGQGDGYPMSGGALTPTWKPGELVTDEHRIELSEELPAGDYALRIGFYLEPSNERLPLSSGGDTFTWTQPIKLKRP